MIEKIKSYQHKLPVIIASLQDVRTLGLLAFLVVALMISRSGVKIIETNYRIQKDIASLQQQNAVRKLENRNLELKNQYFESEEYLELEARKNFGLAAPGEKVLVVPKNVALRYTTPEKNAVNTVSAEKKSKRQQNFDAWLDFLLHRNKTIE